MNGNGVQPVGLRTVILDLLAGHRQPSPPCFSGLINVTQPGLESVGLHLSQVHRDAARMAQAAATSYHLFGLGSAVVPLDMCVEAEALGTAVDFREDDIVPMLPTASRAATQSLAEFAAHPLPDDICAAGRLPIVLDAIELLRQDIGADVAIGAWIPGPFTLAMYVVEPVALLESVVENPAGLADCLARLTAVLAAVGRAYRAAGADFLTIHEMGGSPGYLGPASFKRLVLPALQTLISALPAPRVLSVCGRTNRALPLLMQAGADALSVDQLNDVAQSRQQLGDERLLFGNIDPVATLGDGSVADVEQAVAAAIANGVDAVWPGCDLRPTVPLANLRAFTAAAQQ